MLPYLLFIAIASVASAALHAFNHFSTPAFVPILLNLIWIIVALGIAPYWKNNPAVQAYLIAIAVLRWFCFLFTHCTNNGNERNMNKTYILSLIHI